jgi:uncharacterized membrane protein
MMTKAQTKALAVATYHLHVGNQAAFLRSVAALIRAASNKKQADAIKAAAYDAQFGGL